MFTCCGTNTIKRNQLSHILILGSHFLWRHPELR